MTPGSAPDAETPPSRGGSRLSAIDAGFLAVESARAPMHLGWAATFAPPRHGPRPTFEQIRRHIEARLERAPRYRQRLAPVPLALGEPVWVDDEDFDIRHHVRRAADGDLSALVDSVMSEPLATGRPLWELWIADRLDDGRVGVVGKAHHCLGDGMASVELMALLLDGAPGLPELTPRAWEPAPAPSAGALVREALRDRLRGVLESAFGALRSTRRLQRALRLPRAAARYGAALAQAALPAAPRTRLNGRLSSMRHLAWSSRPLGDLKAIKEHFGTTINDVLLAASAGALREHQLAGGEATRRLKAMVPVSVRSRGERWGNRLACVYPGLPCEESDPARRLHRVHAAMSASKRARVPELTDAMAGALSHTPRLLRKLVARLLGSPRLFNLTISNIPGPAVPLYLMGCEITRAYPVVPLTEGHGVSIGMTSINGEACFGVYAQAELALDAERIVRGIDAAIDELLALSGGGEGPAPPPAPALALAA